MFSRTKLPILHKKTIDRKFPPQNAERDAFPKKIFHRKMQDGTSFLKKFSTAKRRNAPKKRRKHQVPQKRKLAAQLIKDAFGNFPNIARSIHDFQQALLLVIRNNRRRHRVIFFQSSKNRFFIIIGTT